MTYHKALKAEVALQVRRQRRGVLARVDVVDAVVAAHEGQHASPDRALERRQVHLVLRPFVDVGGHGAAVGLLVVVDEVLGVRDDALQHLTAV